ncbi:hypothetical protein F0919_02690 [Taibaiella lutea]|uniref:Lipoprotein n=1 Tax=Taibaiella lutea TaxID=2608001 RepID=A0A5M6CUB9_9BACT|nr:hypothetical protein [Taibaiella lutea]KAA5536595.1 hypothetical protein F0919_02690 [Taibaiella lutea]
MQRILLTLFITTITFAACQPSRDTYRNDFVKGCVTSYAKDSTVANEKGRHYVEEYCNCVGDKMNAKMNADQWRTFNKSGDTSLSRFKDDIQPCKDEFEQKVRSLKQ